MQIKCPICLERTRIKYHEEPDVLFGATGTWTIYSCDDQENCGHHFLYPLPSEHEIASFYDEYHTHDAKQKTDRGYKSSILIDIIKSLNIGRRLEKKYDDFKFLENLSFKGSLLEIGCGSGGNLERISKLGWEVTGTDFDKKAVEVARKKGLVVYLSEEFNKLNKSQFDVILLSHVIEHIGKPKAFLQNLNVNLNKNGYLVVLTPNVDSFSHNVFKEKWRGLEVPRHLNLFSVGSLLKVLSESGYYVYQCGYTPRGAGIFIDSLYLRYKNGFLRNRFVKLAIVEIAYWISLLIYKLQPKKSEEIILIAKRIK